MEPGHINWITGFIWGIADDVLRDLYVRGKYRDVILPMVVLRRFDAVLEPAKQDVLTTRAMLGTYFVTSLMPGQLSACSGQKEANIT